MTTDKKYAIFTGFILFSTILFKLFFSETTFFWDAITCLSEVSHLFYENNLDPFISLGAIDNGDPHIIQYYLAIVWKLFGKNLLISHIAFLPIAIGAVYQVILLSRKIFLDSEKNDAFTAFAVCCLLVIADPTVMTQFLLLGTDVWIAFLALYALNQILANNKIRLAFAFSGLCLTTRRGMIIAAALMIAYAIKFFILGKNDFSVKKFIKATLPVLPGCTIVLIFVLYRFYCYGWVFSSPDSAWAATSGLVDLHGLIHNTADFIWKNLDFGRIGLWIAILFLLFKFGYKKLFSGNTVFLWICYLTLQVAFICVTIPITNSMGARYFLIQFMLLAVIVIKLIFELLPAKQARLIGVLLIGISATGNLWLYPEKIAQNWDGSLKHLPFYTLRKDCFSYMEKENIPYDKAASGFCFYNNQKYLDLIDEDRIISDEITDETSYFIYSNISNLPDEQIDELNSDKWLNIKTFQRNGIFIHLLQKSK